MPFHDGVISQFEGYGQLAELDWDNYRQRYDNIQRLDRILEAEHDDVNRYKASEQADALMLLYLLSSDELREFSIDSTTTSGPTNPQDGGLLHGPDVARIDAERRCAYLGARPSESTERWNSSIQVLKSDVADIQGGTTPKAFTLPRWRAA